MFGMGMGEIILIAVVALLVLGPERLPGAAKAIGKGIRDLRAQTKDLQQTIEKDSQIGEAVREIRTALRGDPESLYKAATGEDFRDKAGASKPERPTDNKRAESDLQEEKPGEAKVALSDAAPEPAPPTESVINEEIANTDESWGQVAQNPHDEDPADPELPVIRTPAGVMARDGDGQDDDPDHG